MSDGRLRLAFTGDTMGSTLARMVRFADKALHAFPTPLPAHGLENTP